MVSTFYTYHGKNGDHSFKYEVISFIVLKVKHKML